MFLQVVPEDGVGLLCSMVFVGVLYHFVCLDPIIVESCSTHIERAIHHFHLSLFAWHEGESDAMGADGAIRECGEQVCQIGFVEISGEGTLLVFGSNVSNLVSAISVQHVIQIHQIARIADAL